MSVIYSTVCAKFWEAVQKQQMIGNPRGNTAPTVLPQMHYRYRGSTVHSVPSPRYCREILPIPTVITVVLPHSPLPCHSLVCTARRMCICGLSGSDEGNVQGNQQQSDARASPGRHVTPGTETGQELYEDRHQSLALLVLLLLLLLLLPMQLMGTGRCS